MILPALPSTPIEGAIVLKPLIANPQTSVSEILASMNREGRTYSLENPDTSREIQWQEEERRSCALYGVTRKL